MTSNRTSRARRHGDAVDGGVHGDRRQEGVPAALVDPRQRETEQEDRHAATTSDRWMTAKSAAEPTIRVASPALAEPGVEDDAPEEDLLGDRRDEDDAERR